MQLSVSNLGWPAKENDWCLETLAKNGISGIEVAPLKVFDSWDQAGDINSVTKVKNYFESHGMKISSFQAITFGAHNLNLLGSEEGKKNLLVHLKKVATLLSLLDGEYAVFGSPGLRKDQDYSNIELTEVFTSINEIFSEHGVNFALETVPSYYGCAVLNKLEDTENFFSKLQFTHVVRHFDSGCQFLSGDLENKEFCERFLSRAEHLHISEVDLNNFAYPSAHNIEVSEQVKSNYKGKWCVLEMGDKSFSRDAFTRSIKNFVALFG